MKPMMMDGTFTALSSGSSDRQTTGTTMKRADGNGYGDRGRDAALHGIYDMAGGGARGRHRCVLACGAQRARSAEVRATRKPSGETVTPAIGQSSSETPRPAASARTIAMRRNVIVGRIFHLLQCRHWPGGSDWCH